MLFPLKLDAEGEGENVTIMIDKLKGLSPDEISKVYASGQVWVLDSESVPFRSFSFETILADFWRAPTVYYIDAPKDAYFPPREGFLLNASAEWIGPYIDYVRWTRPRTHDAQTRRAG